MKSIGLLLLFNLTILCYGCFENKKMISDDSNENISEIDTLWLMGQINSHFGVNTNNYIENHNLRGKVKSLKHKKFELKYKFGEETIGNQVGFTQIYSFDERGHLLIKRNIDSLNIEVSKYEYQYNSNNELIHSVEYEMGKPMVEFTHKYDLNGNRLKTHYTYFPETYQSTFTYDYGNSNELIVVDFIDNKGKLIQRDKYSYEIKNNENHVLKSVYHPNGELNTSSIFVFNDEGKVTLEYSLEEVENSPFINQNNKVKRVYNSNGLLIINQEYQLNKHIDKEEIIYEYDSLNNIIREEIIRYQGKDTFFLPPVIYNYDLDKFNNWIRKSNPNSIEFREMEYY